jgi:hypothetical protein
MEMIPTFFLLDQLLLLLVLFQNCLFQAQDQEADVVSSLAESKWHLQHNKHPLNMEWKDQTLSCNSGREKIFFKHIH